MRIMEYFKVIEEDGREHQKCNLPKKHQPKKKCDYKSPIITNGKPEEMSAGLKLHLIKTHGMQLKHKWE